jgi:dipeptidyl aminopeptidase/acylaminoacyl peptidase
MRKIFAALAGIFCVLTALAQTPSITFEDWISLKSVGGVTISPDGKHVLYAVTSTNWKENNFDTEIWLSRDGGKPFQLTATATGSSSNARFTPDGKWVSFVADRGSKSQVYLIAVDGGEAFPITAEDDGVGTYEWRPDMQQIAFTRVDPESKEAKAEKEKYGGFGVEGLEFRLSHLWVLNFNLDSVRNAGRLPCYDSKDSTVKKTCWTMPKAKRLTNGNFTVGGFDWSPDGKQIAYTRQPNPLINSGIYADIALLDVSTGVSKTIVQNPSSDFFQRWSNDGRQIVYTSNVNDTVTHFFKNNRVFIMDLASGKSREVLSQIDENKNLISWDASGMLFGYSDKMRNKMARFDPATNQLAEIATGLDVPAGGSLSEDGKHIAIIGRNFDQLNEIYKGPVGGAMQRVSDMNAQIATWNTPVNEIVSWKSKDGALIEGVLIKPRNFDPSKKYPLLVVIHGGPTGIDRPEPTPTYVYPVMQWCEKGAVVLRVNYRGSAGYGEKFRALNVRNLGVGDMWDVMSGVDFLQSKGFVDTSRMGCMGWSQGGYISAFLTTNTNRFKAISVGAGISNWMTYYVNTDITPFTRQYLTATPWSDPAIYAKTSPMTNINKASTPTLIQHGEFDKRVPIPNAYELYRGLQDRGIPSKLIVYKGFGHGITKPKERLAAVEHNWSWFLTYVFRQ